MVGKSRIWGAKIQDALPRVTPAAGESQSRRAVSTSPTHAFWPLHSECLHAAGARCGADHHHQCGRAARRVRMFRHARRPPRHNKPRSSGRADRPRATARRRPGPARDRRPGRHRGPGRGGPAPRSRHRHARNSWDAPRWKAHHRHCGARVGLRRGGEGGEHLSWKVQLINASAIGRYCRTIARLNITAGALFSLCLYVCSYCCVFVLLPFLGE